MHQRTLDLYGRQEFAKQLLDDLEGFHTPFSVGLDAKWGDGKSFFVDKFLKKECEERKVPMLVYDCFEHERETDPFVSLTKEILEVAKTYQALSGSTSDTFEEKLKQVGKKATSLFMGIAKTAAVAGAKIILKQEIEQIQGNFGSNPDSADTEQDLVKFIEEQLAPGHQIKALKDAFYESITALISEISPEKQFIIVVIDELDRCRPNHAIDVLESVKHLLNIPGIYFLFTYHKAQLKSSLSHIYGAGLDANLYLQKFMDLDIDLPGGGLSSTHDKYVLLFEQYLAKAKLTAPEMARVKRAAQYYGPLSDIYKFSPRDIQRCVLLHVAFEKKGIDTFKDFTIVVLFVLKVKFGDLIGEVSKGRFPLDDDIIAKYQLRAVTNMFEKKVPAIRDALLDEIGFLFYNDINLGNLGVGIPSQSTRINTIKSIKKTLGGTFS